MVFVWEKMENHIQLCVKKKMDLCIDKDGSLCLFLPWHCSKLMTFTKSVVCFKEQERGICAGVILLAHPTRTSIKCFFFLILFNSWIFLWLLTSRFPSTKSTPLGKCYHIFLIYSRIRWGLDSVFSSLKPLKMASLHEYLFSINVWLVWQQSKSIWVKVMSKRLTCDVYLHLASRAAALKMEQLWEIHTGRNDQGSRWFKESVCIQHHSKQFQGSSCVLPQITCSFCVRLITYVIF